MNATKQSFLRSDEDLPGTSPRQQGMPIAIIGMSCKFPGDAVNPEGLWKLCEEGRSAWSEIPRERFNKDAFYHPCGDRTTTTNVTGGHFLKEDIGLFDATFFNMTPEVSATMDPQCRLQLESVYEALENSGTPVEQIAGSRTAVFSGAFYKDYMDSLMRDPEELPRYVMTGNGATMMANRISHFYDLRGPSMTVDTGCSTGLVALHQACQSLKTSDARMAIVVGANIMINPDIFVLWSSLGFLSPDGRCYSFDSRASGYGRGEGIAALVLKPLNEAVRDGDPIRAVIAETALNQDGKTQTITSPSQDAQEELMRLCYARAGLNPLDTAYVEAHGTGTQAGDPTEAGAIHAVFCKERSDPLYIGSVKSNIGHLETASGFASIIKVALALEKGLIPPSINYEQGNAKIPFDEWNLKIPRRLEPWPEGYARRASINNFGYGGANAHVIMEAWQPYLVTTINSLKIPVSLELQYDSHTVSRASSSVGMAEGCFDKEDVLPIDTPTSSCSTPSDAGESSSLDRRVMILSAKDEVVLRTMIERLRDYSSTSSLDDSDLINRLAHTLGNRRSKFPWRVAFSCPATKSDLLAALDDSALVRPARSTKVPRLGFVFTGQGAQWYAMGRELIDVYPVFSATLQEADKHLRDMDCTWSLVDELTKDEGSSLVNDVVLSPPLCIAVQIGLVRLLESWNVRPTAITSHSSGEIAAAYAAGLLDLREAMAIVFARGAFLQSLQENAHYRGAMIVAGIGRDEAQALIDEMGTTESTVVACENSPSSVTISGDQNDISRLENKLNEDKIFVRALKVPVAYHSHHMNPVADDYLAALVKVLREERSFKDVHYTSPVTGNAVTDSSMIDPSHWVKNMLQPVLFVDSLSAMCLSSGVSGDQLIDTIVEVGPHAALAGPIRQTLKVPHLKPLGITYDSCLWRSKNAVTTMHDLAASLVAKGYPVNLDAVNFPTQTRIPRALGDLPSYPWNHRTRYWYESRINRAHREKESPRHDLLGSRLLGSSPNNLMWRHFIRTSELPWVVDHKVQSDIVYPGAGLICMALEAMRQLNAKEGGTVAGYKLRDVDILQALVIPNSERGIEVQLTLQHNDDKTLGLKGWRKFSICSIENDGSWREHCGGLINVETKQQDESDAQFHDDHDQTLALADPDSIFAFFRSVGIHHGESFRNLQTIKAGPGKSITSLKVADMASMMPAKYQSEHLIHPSTLDSIVVAAYSSLPGCGTHLNSGMVPRHIKSMYISDGIDRSPGDCFQAHSTLVQVDGQGFHASVTVQNGSLPRLAVQIDDLYCVSIGTSPTGTDAVPNKCLKIEWAEDLTLNPLSTLEARLKTTPNPEESVIVEGLNRACFHFFHKAISSLSHSDVEGLLWYHRMYYEWMKVQISQQPKAAEWLRGDDEEIAALFAHVASASTSGNLVCRMGHNLVGILQQQIAPLELMLQDQLLYRYYQEALHIGSSYRQIFQLVGSIAHKNPQAKVLEIGGGTGGCTSHVLRALGGGDTAREVRFSHYDFTDVSVSFFDEAKSRFAPWGDMVQYRKLDIEVNPVEQGYENGTYDLIVACQVLHATTNIDKTMTHVRGLLKPGGKLLLVETTHDSHDIQLIFGVLPGWWLSEEPERKQSPNLSPDLWDTVLSRNGFSGVDLRIKDCEDDDKYVIDVMISTAAEEITEFPHQKVSIICAASVQPNDLWLDQLVHEIKATTPFEPVVENLATATLDGKKCIFLDDIVESILVSPDSGDFEKVKRLVTNAQGVMWVSYGAAIACENPSSALHSGFLRTLRCEDTSKRYISLDLDYHNGSPLTCEASSAIARVVAYTFDFSQPANTVDMEYALRDGSILTPRVYEDQTKSDVLSIDEQIPITELHPFNEPGREVRLIAQTPGMLDSLVFVDNPEAYELLPDGYVEIEPKAFGLNFRDVMVAMGQLQTNVMGFECSGIISKIGPNESSQHGLAVGDRVCALLRGHWATHTRVHWSSVAKIPDTMTFEAAAAIPIVYITAYYSLYQLANIQEGETILIHSAAGGVGQAAIQFAKLAGATIFATVGSKEKEDLIVEQYGLPRQHIFSSRDTSFAKHVRRLTNGQGVDVVLNSLAGDLLHETWACVAPFGRFVEIGKRDFEQNNSLQMAPFTRAASFFAVDLFQLGALKPRATAIAFKAIMDYFERKQLAPLAPISTYPISQLEKAFRTMQSGKHLGKIVIVPSSEDLVKKQVSRVTLSPTGTYLVVGGAGGIGKSVVRRLVDLGARYIALLSRNAESGQHRPFLLELRSIGVKIRAINTDIADLTALEAADRVLKDGFPPVKGVIQAAMVLQDAIIENMTHEDYVNAVRPKVQGTWNLHNHFRDLDFFIMLSSLVGMGGNSSQSNYAAGGSFEDAVARYRSARGLPAVCLDLGMIGGVGYVARTAGVTQRLERQGYQTVSEEEVLKLVQDAIASPYRILNESQLLVGVTSNLESVARDDSPFLADVRFSGLRRKASSNNNSGNSKQGGRCLQDLGTSLASAAAWDDAIKAICQAIISKLSVMFGIPEEDIDPAASMSHYGVDSLVAVELRNWLSSASQSDMSIFDIMQSKSLTSLAKVACGKSKLVSTDLKPSS